MKDLNQYVLQKNEWNKIFNNSCYDLESAADRQRIADALDADLSPENLTCDGELPRAQVLTRLTFLNKAVAQLLVLDPSVQMYVY